MMYLRTLIFIGIVMLQSCGQKQKTPEKAIAEKGEKEYQLLILAGQSNMAGQGVLDELDAATTALPPNIKLIDHCLSTKLKPIAGNFGPEIGVAKGLFENFPEQEFILLKYAIGGSSLFDWAPDYEISKAEITGNPHFGAMYDSLLLKIGDLKKKYRVKPAAMLWMQGERDAKIVAASTVYEANLSQLIQRIRIDLNTADLPFVYGHVNPPASKYAGLKTVRDAQMNLSREVSNTFLVPTEGVEKKEDNLHYSSKGQLELGRRFGEKVINAIKE